MSSALLRCAVCGAEVGVGTVMPWRCPNASGTDRHHVLHRVARVVPFRPLADAHPFIRFDPDLLWAQFAGARGLDLDARAALVHELDDALTIVDGRGFAPTPFFRADSLSDALGFAPEGGLWLKDETVDVAGSAKARHLAPILLYLLALERQGLLGERAPLAIASCGNAALAAATLARAVDWPIRVFIPEAANPAIVARLEELGAVLRVCPRQSDDPPGDPCIHRFHEEVEAGAIPFSVQGPENALCLDGGRTIAWECTEMLGPRIDRFYVQVGGGALATSFALACGDAGFFPRLIVVQAAGCAPLARAWDRWQHGARSWGECMWPWESEPRSVAGGILDDETYDWLGIVGGLERSDGSAVVVAEDDLRRANDLVAAHTSISADHTGTAALAGVLAQRHEIGDDELVVVPITGVRR